MSSPNVGFNKQRPARTGQRTSSRDGIRNVLAPTVRWIAARHRALIRQRLGPQSSSAMAKLEASSEDIEATVVRRAEARLSELLEEEVYSAFEETVGAVTPEGAEWETAEEATEDQELESHRIIQESEQSNDADRVPIQSHVSGTKTGRKKASGEVSAGQQTAAVPDEEPYEGTVMLVLGANSPIGRVVQFVRELRSEPEIRLLKLTGSHDEDVGILLSLREPVLLSKMLSRVEGVSGISMPAGPGKMGQQRQIIVDLADESVHADERGARS